MQYRQAVIHICRKAKQIKKFVMLEGINTIFFLAVACVASQCSLYPRLYIHIEIEFLIWVSQQYISKCKEIFSKKKNELKRKY